MGHIDKKELEKAASDAIKNDWRQKLNAEGLHGIKLKQVRRNGQPAWDLIGDEKDLEKAKKVLGIAK